MSHTIMNTARISALADPNIMKSFQKHIPALSPILSNNFLFKRFIMDILPSGTRWLPCYSAWMVFPWGR